MGAWRASFSRSPHREVFVKEKRKRSFGAPPADWLTQSDVFLRGAAETQKLPRIGGPPREFGDASKRKAAQGPPIVLIVSECRDSAARLALLLASARLSIRLALTVGDVEPLLDGSTVVFAVLPPSADAAYTRSLRHWGEGRILYGLAPSSEAAERVRGICDATLTPPWDIVGALATLPR